MWVGRRDFGWGGQGNRVARVAGNYVKDYYLAIDNIYRNHVYICHFTVESGKSSCLSLDYSCLSTLALLLIHRPLWEAHYDDPFILTTHPIKINFIISSPFSFSLTLLLKLIYKLLLPFATY